jgi:hypothetical protein
VAAVSSVGVAVVSAVELPQAVDTTTSAVPNATRVLSFFNIESSKVGFVQGGSRISLPWEPS